MPEMSTETRFQRLKQNKSTASSRSKSRPRVSDNTGNRPDNPEGDGSGDESPQFEFAEITRVTSDMPQRPEDLKADKKTIRYLAQR